MSKVVFLFPGQGSQYVGMCKDILSDFVNAKEIFRTGSDVTGIDLARLVLEGPSSDLMRTENLQPALTAVDMAICSAAREMGLTSAAVAGHSLGEYPALWAAGVITLEDVFRLVAERGRLMSEAGKSVSGSMAAVIGLSAEELVSLIEPLQQKRVISLANHNSPEQIVLTGERGLISEACKLVKEHGARAIPLKVAGPFHSPLMKDAADKFLAVLSGVEFSAPSCPVYSNVSAQAETDPVRIKDLLGRQMCSPVRWYETLVNMQGDGHDTFVELGPKKVLYNLVKKSLSDVKIFQAEDTDGIKSVLDGI